MGELFIIFPLLGFGSFILLCLLSGLFKQQQVYIANFMSSFRYLNFVYRGFGLAFLLLFASKVVEVRQLMGASTSDPLHGERNALAQRDCAITGMMVFVIVLLRLSF